MPNGISVTVEVGVIEGVGVNVAIKFPTIHPSNPSKVRTNHQLLRPSTKGPSRTRSKSPSAKKPTIIPPGASRKRAPCSPAPKTTTDGGVGVDVSVDVGVRVEVGVAVGVSVLVDVEVAVGVVVGVAVAVGVGVGVGMEASTDAPMPATLVRATRPISPIATAKE